MYRTNSEIYYNPIYYSLMVLCQSIIISFSLILFLFNLIGQNFTIKLNNLDKISIKCIHISLQDLYKSEMKEFFYSENFTLDVQDLYVVVVFKTSVMYLDIPKIFLMYVLMYLNFCTPVYILIILINHEITSSKTSNTHVFSPRTKTQSVTDGTIIIIIIKKSCMIFQVA